MDKFVDNGIRESGNGIMVFNYIQKIRKTHANSPTTYNQFELAGSTHKTKFCCESLKKEVCIEKRIALRFDYNRKNIMVAFLQSYWDYDGAMRDTAYIKIDFCPFCGSKFELNRVKLLKEQIKIIQKQEIRKSYERKFVEIK